MWSGIVQMLSSRLLVLTAVVLSRKFDHFRKCDRAVVAIIFALVAAPLITLAMGTIDYAHVRYHQTKIQAAMDAAIIAATDVMIAQDQMQEVAIAAFRANIGDYADHLNSEPVFTEEEVSTNRRVTRFDYSSKLASLFGMFFHRIIGDDEGWTIEVHARAEHTIKLLEISLVLDISASMSGDRMPDMKEAAKKFVDAMLRSDEDRLIVRINLIPFGGNIRLPKAFDVFATESWRPEGGCLDIDYNDVSNELLTDDYLPLHTYGTLNPEFAPWNDGSPWCPRADSAALIMENDPDRLKDRIDSLTISAGTGTDQALGWGLKFLSEKWRDNIPGVHGADTKDKPADYSEQSVMKVLILMTDGTPRAQQRPIDPNVVTWPDVRTRKNGPGAYPDNQVFRLVDEGICPEIKRHGITLYTVGFWLGLEEDDSQGNFEILRNCASTPSHFYHAEGQDISDVFGVIAAQLKPLALIE